MTQPVTAVSQQPQRDGRAVSRNNLQPIGAQRDDGHRVSVGGIGLAALAGGEYPRPRRQLRRNIKNGLTVSDQPLGNMPANAAASPGRPHAVREPAAYSQHRLVTVAVSAEPALRQNPLAAVDHLDRRRPLMRVHPDDHMSHDSLSSTQRAVAGEEGSATSSRTRPS